MSARIWKDLEDCVDRRPIVVATLARNLRMALLSRMRSSGHNTPDISVRVAGRVADLHPRVWTQAERIRSMALATVELDADASASALEFMSKEVTRMLETLVFAAQVSSGAPRLGLTTECSDSSTWNI